MMNLTRNFLLLFLFTFSYTYAQVLPLDSTSKKVQFSENITADTLSRERLEERTQEWLTNYYNTSKFEINDKTNGKLGTEGTFVVSLTYDFKYKSENNVGYQVVIQYAQGSYKYTLSNFTIYNVKTGPKSSQALETSFSKMTLQNKKELLSQLNSNVKRITEDLKKTINTGEITHQEVWKY